MSAQRPSLIGMLLTCLLTKSKKWVKREKPKLESHSITKQRFVCLLTTSIMLVLCSSFEAHHMTSDMTARIGAVGERQRILEENEDKRGVSERWKRSYTVFASLPLAEIE